MDFEWDCIVVGAGPAGLGAALMLGRARRRVLVLDSEEPRNYAAREMHGVLGHDGLDPAELRRRGREEISRYGIDVRHVKIDPSQARLVDGGVEIAGERARTAVLATGMLDDTPQIDGFDELYGISAHTCPYCDGWEHRDKRIAVYTTMAGGGAHLGSLLRQWSGDVVVLTDGSESVDAEEEAALGALGVPVVRERVTRFAHADGHLTAVELEGAEPVERDALFFGIAMRARTELAVALGCELTDSGLVVADETTRQTTVDRVYAIGNCTNGMHNVSMASGDGARAGAMINHRLVTEGVVQPAAASAGAVA